MANRPSHAVQERIIAFVASKPNREITRNGSVETCTSWLGKRLNVPEKTVISELDALEQDGKVKLTHLAGNRGIKQIQLVYGVEPEPWAMAQVEVDEIDAEVRLPANLDYRQLAENVLLAALEVIGTSNDQKIKDDEIAHLTEVSQQIRAELSHVKAERDAAIRAKKVAEEAAHAEKNKADEVQAMLAERDGDLRDLREEVKALHKKVRGSDILGDLSSEDRYAVGLALSRLIEP